MKTDVLNLGLEPKVLKFAEFEPLNEVELRETEGGFIPFAVIEVVALLVAAGYAMGKDRAEADKR